ncbi:MAG: hypothetical protein CHACPFDD_03481 [Phycisphaerae bacterium]|nr:hypothetical protein [Phycisphaerae bacterium]
MPVNPQPAAHPFDVYVRQPEARIRLAEAALLFARDHCATLKVQPWLDRLAGLAQRVRSFDGGTHAQRAEALRHVIVEQEHYTGSHESYQDPRSSLLNETIARRTGIPITLAVIWIDVGRQLGWSVDGIGLPGHFIVRVGDADDGLLLDPFHDGAELTRDDCTRLVRRLVAQPITLTDEHFAAVSTRMILMRMLNNLLGLALNRRDWSAALLCVSRQLALAPDAEELHGRSEFIRARLAEQN